MRTKIKRYINLSLATLLLISLESCMDDSSTLSNDGESTSIEIAVPGSRSLDTSVSETSINHLRVLIFKSSTQKLAFSFLPSQIDNKVFTLDIMTGTYDFVFIANERSDETTEGGKTLSDKLNEVETVYDLDKLSVHCSSFSNEKHIPMYRMYCDVKIELNNSTWNVELERLGIKISALTLGAASAPDGFTGVKFTKLPTYIALSKAGRSADFTHEVSYAATHFTDVSAAASTLFPGNSNIKWVYQQNSDAYLILPSSEFTPVTATTNACRLEVTTGADPNPGAYWGVDMPTDYTLPRNSNFKLKGILPQADELTFNLKVVVEDWMSEDLDAELH